MTPLILFVRTRFIFYIPKAGERDLLTFGHEVECLQSRYEFRCVESNPGHPNARLAAS